MNNPASQDDRIEKTENAPIKAIPPRDLDKCPRCGYKIDTITWGKTNCPNCGLHFECC